jgi:hypothetical protein
MQPLKEIDVFCDCCQHICRPGRRRGAMKPKQLHSPSPTHQKRVHVLEATADKLSKLSHILICDDAVILSPLYLG